MTNLEIRVNEEMKVVLNNETKNFEVLEGLVFSGDIYELSIEDRVFGHDDIEEFCGAYARVHMGGSWEDRVLNMNCDEELAGITKEEAMEFICEREIENQIEWSKED